MLHPHYVKRRQAVRAIPRFWPIVLSSCDELADYISYEDDELLESLADLYVEWDQAHPQNFVIELVFDRDNGFLEPGSCVLRKEFRFVAREAKQQGGSGQSNGPAAAPVTVEKYVSDPVPLNWLRKKNLTRSTTGSTNSFFNWFRFTGEGPGDYSGGETVALTIAEVVFPHAIKLFVEGMNDAEGEDDEESDVEDEYELEGEAGEDEEEEGEAEHEDMPPKKKVKTGKD